MLFAHMGMEHSSPKIMMSFNISFLEIILRLSMATIFAAIIGLDRKEHNHPAGLRTHILVMLRRMHFSVNSRSNLQSSSILCEEFPHFIDGT